MLTMGTTELQDIRRTPSPIAAIRPSIGLRGIATVGVDHRPRNQRQSAFDNGGGRVCEFGGGGGGGASSGRSRRP